MSATMRRTITALVAAALVGTYVDSSSGQPREPGDGALPAPSAQPRAATPPNTQADDHAVPRLGEGPDWHGDIGQFPEHDLRVWQSGQWRQGVHDGRLGWWWIVSGVWYFYPSPVYPYPDPFAPPFVAPPPAGMTYWYYCQSYEQYYPYVATCPEGWRAVPAAHERAGTGSPP